MNNTSNIKHDTSAQLMLSIVVPVYNSEKYLEECLLSLYKQDIPLESYEVIAIDNGSRDSSAAIIDRLQIEYPNLRKVTLEINQLPSGARNVGMDTAQGKYLMFVDSDDLLYPNMLKSLLDIMEVDNLDFAHFDADLLENGQIVKGQRTQVNLIQSGIEFYNQSPCYKAVSWSKIYLREFIENHHLRCAKGLIYEDDEFSFKLYSIAKRVRHIDIIPYIFRQHPHSTTKNRISLANFVTNLIENDVLYADLYGDHKIIEDKLMVKEATSIIRYNIFESFRVYPLLSHEEQKEAKKLLLRYITFRYLPYMSRKRFLLLKLGIVR